MHGPGAPWRWYFFNSHNRMSAVRIRGKTEPTPSERLSPTTGYRTAKRRFSVWRSSNGYAITSGRLVAIEGKKLVYVEPSGVDGPEGLCAFKMWGYITCGVSMRQRHPKADLLVTVYNRVRPVAMFGNRDSLSTFSWPDKKPGKQRVAKGPRRGPFGARLSRRCPQIRICSSHGRRRWGRTDRGLLTRRNRCPEDCREKYRTATGKPSKHAGLENEILQSLCWGAMGAGQRSNPEKEESYSTSLAGGSHQTIIPQGPGSSRRARRGRRLELSEGKESV